MWGADPRRRYPGASPALRGDRGGGRTAVTPRAGHGRRVRTHLSPGLALPCPTRLPAASTARWVQRWARGARGGAEHARPPSLRGLRLPSRGETSVHGLAARDARHPPCPPDTCMSLRGDPLGGPRRARVSHSRVCQRRAGSRRPPPPMAAARGLALSRHERSWGTRHVPGASRRDSWERGWRAPPGGPDADTAPRATVSSNPQSGRSRLRSGGGSVRDNVIDQPLKRKPGARQSCGLGGRRSVCVSTFIFPCRLLPAAPSPSSCGSPLLVPAVASLFPAMPAAGRPAPSWCVDA